MKVLLTDHDYDPVHERRLVAEAGHTLVTAQCRTEADLIDAGRDADALLVQYAPVTAEVLRHLTHCRVVVRNGVGVDTVDLAAAAARGVYVANVPDYCLHEVSDHALALLLSAARRVVAYDRQIRQGLWDAMREQPIHRLQGRILGLVGFGNIARTLAGKAAGIGLAVHAHDPYVPAAAMEEAGVVPHETLDTLLGAAHYVSLHAPLTPATRHLINAETLGLMRPDAVLINTARGGLVDSLALADALGRGQIAGAALDVLEEEPPPPDHPLRAEPRVILTPHAAYYTEEGTLELKEKMVRQVAQVLDHGEPPTYWVNRSGFVPHRW